MRYFHVFALALLLAHFSACAEKISFKLPSAATVVIYEFGTKSERNIQPRTELHQKLGVWVDGNQDGWQPYMATAPALGIIVRAEELDLQFVGGQVLLHSRRGVFVKKVAPGEYAFLSVNDEVSPSKRNRPRRPT